MTNEERDIITAFIARIGGGAPAAAPSAWGGGSVPATQAAPPLPPVDPDAARYIAQQMQSYPDAQYRMTQLAFVQEHALVEAQNRLRRMEWELQQTHQAMQQQAGSGGQQGGFFSSLFGGGRQASPGAGAPGGPWGQAPGQGQPYSPAPPPPQYPPGYQAGAFQRAGGSGFLGSALTTAAGVAGGVLAANAIRDMFSPNQGMFGGGMGGGMGGGFGGGAGMAPDQGYVDQGTWDQGAPDQSNWNDPGPGTPDDSGGGGWDPGGGGDSGGGDWGGGGGSSDDSLI